MWPLIGEKQKRRCEIAVFEKVRATVQRGKAKKAGTISAAAAAQPHEV